MDTFLTAYDPSDLPGASIDPLGFERGYLFLADKILPGLTNVASHPRYFGLICAGVHIADEGADGGTPRELFQQRREAVLQLERLWALANVLAYPDEAGGVRGVTYAKTRAEELQRSGDSRVSAKYQLLSRQIQYGAIGMYASVADGMRFLNRDDFALSPALGEAIAEAFIEETGLPNTLRRAILDNSDVPVATLKSWGERAYVGGEVTSGESKCLLDALHGNPVRSCMVEQLKLHRSKGDQEAELDRLARIVRALDKHGQHGSLREAIVCILEYEACYRRALLAFERLLWLCRQHAGARVTMSELDGDEVMLSVRERLPVEAKRFLGALDGREAAFREGLDYLADVRVFLDEASAAAVGIDAFLNVLVARHSDVQRGKFDRGRRKMPWLEFNDSHINLTMSRVGGRRWETTTPEEIAPHPYRLAAADALIVASSKALQP